MKRLYFIAACVSLLLVLIFVGAYLYASLRIQSAADCTSVETFDPKTKTCYYECSTDEECDRLAKAVDAELDSFFETSQSLLADDHSNTPTNDASKRVYANKSGMLTPTVQGEDASIWKLFGRVVGSPVKTNIIDTFTLYDDDQDATAAAVWKSDADADKWNASVNLAYKDNTKDLLHTLVHEYGHIISLSTDQVSEVGGVCPTFELSEGCMREGSYIQAFHELFWSSYGSTPSNDGANADEVTAFYQSNGGDSVFISEYAATNSVEDFAESFANFVLQPKPKDEIVRDKKIRMMYEFPELVKERNRIRAALTKELSERRLLKP